MRAQNTRFPVAIVVTNDLCTITQMTYYTTCTTHVLGQRILQLHDLPRAGEPDSGEPSIQHLELCATEEQ